MIQLLQVSITRYPHSHGNQVLARIHIEYTMLIYGRTSNVHGAQGAIWSYSEN